jgi:hypothetical protein
VSSTVWIKNTQARRTAKEFIQDGKTAPTIAIPGKFIMVLSHPTGAKAPSGPACPVVKSITGIVTTSIKTAIMIAFQK